MAILQRRKLQAVSAPALAPQPSAGATMAALSGGWSQAFGDGDGVVNLVSLRTCERCGQGFKG